MEFQVMTCNLRVNVSVDGANAWPYRVSSVVQLFQHYRPFVIGTQEGLIDMLHDLDAQLDDYAWIGCGRDGGQAGEHVAIFYRTKDLSVVDAGHFWLSLTPEEPSSSWDTACPRMCTWGHFRMVNAPYSEFIVFNTHLDHVSQWAREEGAALIRDEAMRMYKEKSLPIMVTGDMNCHPDNPVIRVFCGDTGTGVSSDVMEGERKNAFLQSVYEEMSGPIGTTFHGFDGGLEGEPIDYVFLTRDCNVVDAKVDRARYAGRLPSDHYPLVATVRLPS